MAAFNPPVARSILVVRGYRVLLDEQFAAFYGVETRVLVQAVKRNINRFPEDFMLRLGVDEWAVLRPQVETSSLRSQNVILKMRVLVKRPDTDARFFPFRSGPASAGPDRNGENRNSFWWRAFLAANHRSTGTRPVVASIV